MSMETESERQREGGPSEVHTVLTTVPMASGPPPSDSAFSKAPLRTHTRFRGSRQCAGSSGGVGRGWMAVLWGRRHAAVWHRHGMFQRKFLPQRTEQLNWHMMASKQHRHMHQGARERRPAQPAGFRPAERVQLQSKIAGDGGHKFTH